MFALKTTLYLLFVIGIIESACQPAFAIPAFARKYGVKCYACHMMPPVLNKTGYMFKRLGYRMPPDQMVKGPAPKITDLDPESRWTITNSMALVTQGSFSVDKAKEGDQSESKSSFNLDKALLFAASSIPQTSFSYLAEYKLYEDGESALETAVLSYTKGRANNSFFAKAGMMHVQEGEGTRGAMMFSLFPEPAPTLASTSPTNFSLDQHPVGINVGYTWAAPLFKQIVGISAKVTNGLDASGEPILGDSTKNAKDFWLNADYLFGPEGGLTFLAYTGRKYQVQNQGAEDEFTYYPSIRRYGVFGNYLFFDKLDVVGGYIRSRDGWKNTADQNMGAFVSDGYRGELDYYIRRGFALMARYDRLNQKISDSGRTRVTVWGVGAQKALTSLGNIIIRGSYTHEHAQDPISSEFASDKMLRVDLRWMW